MTLSVRGHTILNYITALRAVYKPRGCGGHSVTPFSINLCVRLLRPLTGQNLVAVFTEPEDREHVSPLLPPQRVSFVQRRELTERGERG